MKKIIFSAAKRQKFFYLALYFILACFFVLMARPVYLVSILVVLGPPSFMNFLWLKNSRFKVFIFSLTATVLFAPPVELVSRLANVWDVQSVLWRPFGLIPLENMLFAFFNFFWALSFYEYFIDKDKAARISKKFKYLAGLFALLAFSVFTIYFLDKEIIALNYMTMAVPVLLIPSLMIFFKKPTLLKKTILPTLFFASVFFIYEIVSLETGSWWWPGHYIFAFDFLGHVFPLDDVIIWYFLSTPALIGGYEFFADDFV